MTRRGLLLGKFMPPHAGHLHLAAVAQRLCDRLTIVVGTQPDEPINGALRHQWMRDLCPASEVLHLHRQMPQTPAAHPQFWALWRDALHTTMGGLPDVVFAGEPYGADLARHLGATFIPLPRSDALAISGTAVRGDPGAHWSLLPGPVRAHLCRRVRVVGPESAGKTTLCRSLAASLGATWVSEFARGYLEARGGAVEFADMALIARGQAASEDALAELGGPLLIADTDPTLTAVWCEALFGEVPEQVEAIGRPRRYAHTFLTAPTAQWQQDSVRYQPEVADRVRFFDRCLHYYPDAIVLDGPWQDRTRRALTHLEASHARDSHQLALGHRPA